MIRKLTERRRAVQMAIRDMLMLLNVFLSFVSTKFVTSICSMCVNFYTCNFLHSITASVYKINPFCCLIFRKK